MGRYVIQSGVTFAFLHSDPRTGDVSWTPSLLAALHFGVVEDLDQVAQLVDDHCDRGAALICDLDLEPAQ